MIPLPEIGLGKTGTAAAAATGIAGSKAGQPAGAAGSGNVVLYGDSEVMHRTIFVLQLRTYNLTSRRLEYHVLEMLIIRGNPQRRNAKHVVFWGKYRLDGSTYEGHYVRLVYL